MSSSEDNYPPVHLPADTPGKWIRLLEILPEKWDADFRLTLRLANLDEKPGL